MSKWELKLNEGTGYIDYIVKFDSFKAAYKLAFGFIRTKAFRSVMITREDMDGCYIILRWSRGFSNAITMRPIHTNQERLYIFY